MGFMAAFHDDWRLSIRIITPLPLLHVAVYWFLLQPRGRVLAEATRQRTSAGKGAEAECKGNLEAPNAHEKRISILFPPPQSPQPSLFSYPGSFQSPLPYLTLHPDADQTETSFHDVLERFGCPREQDEIMNRTTTIRPPTPIFGRFVS